MHISEMPSEMCGSGTCRPGPVAAADQIGGPAGDPTIADRVVPEPRALQRHDVRVHGQGRATGDLDGDDALDRPPPRAVAGDAEARSRPNVAATRSRSRGASRRSHPAARRPAPARVVDDELGRVPRGLGGVQGDEDVPVLDPDGGVAQARVRPDDDPGGHHGARIGRDPADAREVRSRPRAARWTSSTRAAATAMLPRGTPVRPRRSAGSGRPSRRGGSGPGRAAGRSRAGGGRSRRGCAARPGPARAAAPASCRSRLPRSRPAPGAGVPSPPGPPGDRPPVLVDPRPGVR